jgi:hypothetical protein
LIQSREARSSAYGSVLAAVPFDPEASEESLAANLGEQRLMMMNWVVVLELNASRLEALLDGDTPEERFRSLSQPPATTGNIESVAQ